MDRIFKNLAFTKANIDNIYNNKIISNNSTSPSHMLLKGTALDTGTSGIGCEFGLEFSNTTYGIYFRGGTGAINSSIIGQLNGGNGNGYLDGRIYNGKSFGPHVRIRGTTVTVINTSDVKLKKNITDTEENNIIQNLKNIKLRSFDWIADNRHQTIGIIANELREIYPDAVCDMRIQPSDDELLGVKGVMGDVMFLRLLKGFQEQQAQIEEIKNDILLLKNPV